MTFHYNNNKSFLNFTGPKTTTCVLLSLQTINNHEKNRNRPNTERKKKNIYISLLKRVEQKVYTFILRKNALAF